MSEPSRRQFFKNIAGISAAGSGLTTLAKLCAAFPLNDSITNGDEELFWKFVREQFVFRDKLVYLNNGTMGATPLPVLEKVQECFRMLAADPQNKDVLDKQTDEVRNKVAVFVGAEPEEIALVRNTTEGMNLVANGLPLQAGDEVIISTHEHPAGNECWRLQEKRKGIRIVKIPLRTPPEHPDEIIRHFTEAITPRTKVISISHITFSTGLLTPVKELCKVARERGILILVDGAHPPGMIQVNLHDLGCDFYAASFHKWLLAPIGMGLLYVRREVQDILLPLIASGGWDTTNSAKRYETIGFVDVPVRVALGTAIDFQEAIGKERIECRVRSLLSYLLNKLSNIPGITIYSSEKPELSAAVVSFKVKDYSQEKVAPIMRSFNIAVRQIPDYNLNALRLSTHIYNSHKDIDYAVDVLGDIAKNGV